MCIMILCIGVLLMVIHEKNERFGSMNGYTIDYLTARVEDLIQNLEKEEPNVDEHKMLIRQIGMMTGYIKSQNNMSFLDYPTYKYIIRDSKIKDFKSEEAMTALKKYYETLLWLREDLDEYENNYEDYNNDISKYRYFRTHREEIDTKFYEFENLIDGYNQNERNREEIKTILDELCD